LFCHINVNLLPPGWRRVTMVSMTPINLPDTHLDPAVSEAAKRTLESIEW
jgi:hypothetical protein